MCWEETLSWNELIHQCSSYWGISSQIFSHVETLHSTPSYYHSEPR
jgi:hypothetical protein